MAVKRKPRQPDPGVYGSRFIAWLLRHGGVAPMARAKAKWAEEGLDVELFASAMGEDRIGLLRDRRSGDAILCLHDLQWAVEWMLRYGEAMPLGRPADAA